MKLLGIVCVILGLMVLNRDMATSSLIIGIALILIGAGFLMSGGNGRNTKAVKRQDIRIRDGGSYEDTLSDLLQAACTLQKLNTCGYGCVRYSILVSPNSQVCELSFSYSTDNDSGMAELLKKVNPGGAFVQLGNSLVFKSTTVSGWADEEMLCNWQDGIIASLKAICPDLEEYRSKPYRRSTDGTICCNATIELYYSLV